MHLPATASPFNTGNSVFCDSSSIRVAIASADGRGADGAGGGQRIVWSRPGGCTKSVQQRNAAPCRQFAHSATRAGFNDSVAAIRHRAAGGRIFCTCPGPGGSWLPDLLVELRRWHGVVVA